MRPHDPFSSGARLLWDFAVGEMQLEDSSQENSGQRGAQADARSPSRLIRLREYLNWLSGCCDQACVMEAQRARWC